MKYTPQHSALQKHIDHYWVIDDVGSLFKSTKKVYDYPGIRPEILMLLDGVLNFKYQGRKGQTKKHLLASHIHGEFLFDAQALNRFVIIQFKPRSLAALLPFVQVSAQELMKNSVCSAELVFGRSINRLGDHLKRIPGEQIAAEIDDWLLMMMTARTTGFVTDLFSEIQKKQQDKRGSKKSIQLFKEMTNYSYSTIERYFKKETALSPKKYESLSRYKEAVEEIYDSGSDDWWHYITKYGYYDQSHFIKEIKRYTGFTPSQLLRTPGLRTFRPS